MTIWTVRAAFRSSRVRAHEAQFDIDVVHGHARGAVRGEYRDLQVKVVDGKTGRAGGVINRVATVPANELKVKDDNTPEKPAP